MIEILLATYNGAKYLDAQLISLQNQTYKDFSITVRDDGSSDNTLEIINRFRCDTSLKINLLQDLNKRLGSSLSFGALLENSTGEYIMFCDQDDVWLEGKIEKTLKEMLRIEQMSPNQPILIFTDLKEVDESLNILSESFLKNQKLFPEIVSSYNKLLALNVVAGCTIMINKMAKSCSLPIPANNIVHDQWIAVNVARYGKVSYLNEPTILYRQHGNNAVGANEVGIGYFRNKISSPIKQYKIYVNLIKNLSFKISILKFLFHKIYFTIKRL